MIQKLLFPEPISELSLTFHLILVSFHKGDSFGERIVIGLQKSFLLNLAILKSTVSPSIRNSVRFIQIGPDFQFADLCADIPISIVISGVCAGINGGIERFRDGIIGESKFDLKR